MILLNKKIVFSRVGTDKIFSFKYFDDKIHSIEYCDTDNIVGNIYVGIVSDIVKNINAAFVGFAKGLKGYYLVDDNPPIFLNPKNTDKLCQGDRVLVQVSADKVKTKDYTLTSNITFTGRYVVLTVGKTGINISRKIKNASVRQQLKADFSEMKNEEFGFILRTSCEEAPKGAAMAEAMELKNQWNELKQKAMHLTAGSIVKKNVSDVVRISKEAVNKGFGEIIVDDNEIFNELMGEEDVVNSNIVRMYNESYPLHKLYSLEKVLRETKNKKVWLDSGAYLIIEPTEALTVIDVNTGKAELKGKREEVFFKINMEAAKAIACEIRKRNLSGIIIVDFINMKKESNYQKIIEEMKQQVGNDDITTTIAGFTNLGLMEITRKRTKKPIYELI